METPHADDYRIKLTWSTFEYSDFYSCGQMTTIRNFRAEDLFKFNHINLDPLTETYNIPFYMQYVATWPSLCASYEDSNGRMMGYILGKAEGESKLWHGHVTAVTVSPEYRRLGVAKYLMAYLVSYHMTTYSSALINCGILMLISFRTDLVTIDNPVDIIFRKQQEEVSEQLYNCFFVDLFVRASNKLAQMMYGNLGYTVYRQVLGYYSGENSEDAYGESEQLVVLTTIIH